MGELVLVLDQGTSSTKACVYEPPGRVLGQATMPVARRSPAPGATEHDPTEIIASCRDAAEASVRAARVSAQDLVGVALANVGESFLLFDADGRPLTPVIGWQDTRCGTVLDELAARGAGPAIERRTGLKMHAEFSAPKFAHQLAALTSADARFGTLDTWIMQQLDPARPHVTDRATASRTMLIALDDDDWSDDLLDAFAVPRESLPEVKACDDLEVELRLLGRDLPLIASSFDMGLALLGHGCVASGETKATFGTCLGVMASTADRARADADGLLATIPYTRGTARAFALDGEIAAAGALVAWAIDAGIADSVAELDARAASASSTAGVVVVPAISGLGAPHWRDDVRGAIVGLTGAAGRAELARAVLDAIAWSLYDVLGALTAAGLAVGELSVDGGLTRSPTLMQRCADVCQVPLAVAEHQEATALGAAALAMLARGTLSIDELKATAARRQRVEPGPPPSLEERDAWRHALADALARPS